MFKIGDFSKICRIPVSALRYYADIGLLQPLEIDQFTGYRYYSLEQLPRLNRILALKDLGLSLTEIKTVLDDEQNLNIDHLRGMLKLKQMELQHELNERQAQLDRVAARLDQIEQEGKLPEQEVILKQVEPMRVLSYRFMAPSSEVIGHHLGMIFPKLFESGVMPVSAPGTRYHNLDFDPENIDCEIVYPVANTVKDDFPISDHILMTVVELPKVEVATIIHKGDYTLLEVSYTAIGRWIEVNRYQMVGPAREFYLSSPDSPEGAITEIQFPVDRG